VLILKERVTRLKTIRKIIKNNRIDSQDTLLCLLQKEGFEVTQATLSRDLKVLKVGKVSDGHNGYLYALTDDGTREDTEEAIIQDFLAGYLTIETSGNIVVIKTNTGYATVVAGCIDTLGFDEVIGTLAGSDNCVFSCLREGVTGEQFLKKLKERIHDIEID
jgi:transcriptional regulator of arginine metabolism